MYSTQTDQPTNITHCHRRTRRIHKVSINPPHTTWVNLRLFGNQTWEPRKGHAGLGKWFLISYGTDMAIYGE